MNLRIVGVFVCIVACGSESGAEPPVAEVKLTPVFGGKRFEMPVYALQAPGDATSWYVVEKTGRVHKLTRIDSSDAQQVVDVSGRIDAEPSEAGLLSIAFHPRFAENGQVFLSYTAPGSPLVSKVVRMNASGGVFDTASATEILSIDQPFANHNGGQILFGPDGLFYLGFGDGGSAGDPGNRAQNKNELLGKVLRVDVDSGAPYGIPPTNPFARGGGKPEIFAYGLRNPWRMSFDKATGLLWAGDVGQNKWEEIDVVTVGKNYGWRPREGRHCYEKNCGTAGFTEPIAEYDHSRGDVSVTGGFVYRGKAIPKLVGQYVFADFASGRIFTIPAADPKRTDLKPRLLLDSDALISSFAEGADGELYVVDYKGGVFRLVP